MTDNEHRYRLLLGNILSLWRLKHTLTADEIAEAEREFAYEITQELHGTAPDNRQQDSKVAA